MMEINCVNDFKALEALRKAGDDDMIPSRVTIGYDLYTYLQEVLKQRCLEALEVKADAN